jgi:hypothetical protein
LAACGPTPLGREMCSMDIAVPIEEKNGSAWNHCRGVHGRPIAGVMGRFRPKADDLVMH